MVTRGVGVVLIDTLWSVTTFCPRRNTNEAKLVRLKLHIYSEARLLTAGFRCSSRVCFGATEGRWRVRIRSY